MDDVQVMEFHDFLAEVDGHVKQFHLTTFFFKEIIECPAAFERDDLGHRVEADGQGQGGTASALEVTQNFEFIGEVPDVQLLPRRLEDGGGPVPLNHGSRGERSLAQFLASLPQFVDLNWGQEGNSLGSD